MKIKFDIEKFTPPFRTMGRGYDKTSLAKARKAQQKKTASINSLSDSEASDWEYTGGVNCDVSDNTSYYSVSNRSSSNESIVELEGDDLEENLKTLRAVELAREAVNADVSTAYGIIKTYKTAKDWQRAEAVQSLGYNGQSTRTQERRQKNAREQKQFNEKAKTL